MHVGSLDSTLLAVAQSASTGNFSVQQFVLAISLVSGQMEMTEDEVLGHMLRLYRDDYSSSLLAKIKVLESKIEELRRNEIDYSYDDDFPKGDLG